MGLELWIRKNFSHLRPLLSKPQGAIRGAKVVSIDLFLLSKSCFLSYGVYFLKTSFTPLAMGALTFVSEISGKLLSKYAISLTNS